MVFKINGFLSLPNLAENRSWSEDDLIKYKLDLYGEVQTALYNAFSNRDIEIVKEDNEEIFDEIREHCQNEEEITQALDDYFNKEENRKIKSISFECVDMLDFGFDAEIVFDMNKFLEFATARNDNWK